MARAFEAAFGGRRAGGTRRASRVLRRRGRCPGRRLPGAAVGRRRPGPGPGDSPGRRPDRGVRRPGARLRWSTPSAATTSGWCRWPTASSAATSGCPACSPAPTWSTYSTAQPEGHRYLLPDACLSEGRFLDDLTLADLPRPVEVVPTDGLSLRRALDGPARRPSTRRRAARHRPRHPARVPVSLGAAPMTAAVADEVGTGGASGRWWSSPVGPTSASRRWSIASWAVGPPSSRSVPGSPATARSSTPSGADTPSPWSTPVGGCPPATRSTPRSARRPSGPSPRPTWSCWWWT